MKEILFKFLQTAAQPMSADQLIKMALGIQGANVETASRIIRTLIENDNRFQEDEKGFWSITSSDPNPLELARAEFLFLEFFPLSLHSITEVKLAAIYHLKDQKISKRAIQRFSIKQLADAIQNDISKNANSIMVFSGFGKSKKLLAQAGFLSHHIASWMQTVSIRQLARRLYPDRSFTSLSQLAGILPTSHRESDDPAIFMDELIQVFMHLTDELKNLGIHSVSAFLDYYNQPKNILDFSRYNFDRQFLQNIPHQPGVYIMKDRENRIIYVGKAKDLARRVNSYFLQRRQNDPKISRILSQIFSIEYELVGSELEALLREFFLIQQYRPIINRQIKIHKRKIPKRLLKERIFILPASQSNQINLVLLTRIGILKQILIDKNNPNEKHLRREIADFFKKSRESGGNPEPDGIILLSWLRQNADKINWVEIDLTNDLNDLMRLLLLHIQRFEPNAGKTIYI